MGAEDEQVPEEVQEQAAEPAPEPVGEAAPEPAPQPAPPEPEASTEAAAPPMGDATSSPPTCQYDGGPLNPVREKDYGGLCQVCGRLTPLTGAQMQLLTGSS